MARLTLQFYIERRGEVNVMRISYWLQCYWLNHLFGLLEDWLLVGSLVGWILLLGLCFLEEIC